MKDVKKAIELASSANEEDLESLAHHPSSEIIERLINNKNLTEKLAVVLASRKNVKPEMLESLAREAKWKDSYKVRLALCKNPKTPQKITLALLKFLKIFDLGDLTLNPAISSNLRMRIEAAISEKIPAMPLGIKITLAKRASGNVLMLLVEEGITEVVSVCLDSPRMTEGEIYKIINMTNISPQAIRLIASHRKWSCRYMVRWALIRHAHAPLSCIVNFLRDMKTIDLKELYSAPEVPSSAKPYIYRELLEREEVE